MHDSILHYWTSLITRHNKRHLFFSNVISSKSYFYLILKTNHYYPTSCFCISCRTNSATSELSKLNQSTVLWYGWSYISLLFVVPWKETLGTEILLVQISTFEFCRISILKKLFSSMLWNIIMLNEYKIVILFGYCWVITKLAKGRKKIEYRNLNHLWYLY